MITTPKATKQTILTYNNQWDFAETVNKFFDKGWSIVPGTLIASKSACVKSNDFIQTSELYVVVLEKPII